MRRWPLGRRLAADGTRSTAARPAAPPFDAWRSLPPIQRTVPTLAPVMSTSAFTATLSAHAVPQFLAPLGHLVGHDAPSGLVRADSAPPLRAPVQRMSDHVIDRIVTTRGSGAPGRRAWASAPTPRTESPSVSRSLIAADSAGLPILSLPAPTPLASPPVDPVAPALQLVEPDVDENRSEVNAGNVPSVDMSTLGSATKGVATEQNAPIGHAPSGQTETDAATAPLLGDAPLAPPSAIEASATPMTAPSDDRPATAPHTPRRIGLGAPVQRESPPTRPAADHPDPTPRPTAQLSSETPTTAPVPTRRAVEPLVVRGAPTPVVARLPLATDPTPPAGQAVADEASVPLLSAPSLTIPLIGDAGGTPMTAPPNDQRAAIQREAPTTRPAADPPGSAPMPTPSHTGPLPVVAPASGSERVLPTAPVSLDSDPFDLGPTTNRPVRGDAAQPVDGAFESPRVVPVLAQREPLIVVDADDLAATAPMPPDFSGSTDNDLRTRAPVRARPATTSEFTTSHGTLATAARRHASGLLTSTHHQSTTVQRSSIAGNSMTPVVSRRPKTPGGAAPSEAAPWRTAPWRTAPTAVSQAAEEASVSLLVEAPRTSPSAPFGQAAPPPPVQLLTAESTRTLQLDGDGIPPAPIGVDESRNTPVPESSGATAANSPSMSDDQLDRLARRIYPRIRDQWRTELRRDRERAGRAGDLRI